MNVLAIVIACGREEEIADGIDAGFLTLGDAPMLVHCLRTLERTSAVDAVIVAVSKVRADSTIHLVKRYGLSKVKGVVVGGASRQNTLKVVLSKMPNSPSMIMIHEASRPFAARELFEETLKAGKRYGCSIAAHRLPDSVKLAPKGTKVSQTLVRSSVWSAATPQAFRTEVLEGIVQSRSINIIDDESEHVGKSTEVHLVESGPLNMKIRSTEDLAIATAVFNAKLV